MLKPYAERGEKIAELYRYYVRNLENATIAEIVDFVGGVTLVDRNGFNLLSYKESETIELFAVERLLPLTKDENGNLVLDEEKARQGMEELANYAIQLQIEAAKEYKNQYELIAPGTKDRDKIAMFKTRTSEAYYKFGMINTICMMGMDRQDGFYFSYGQIYPNEVWRPKADKYLETLTDDEKFYFNKAVDALRPDPELLKNVEPKDVGLDKNVLKEMEDKSYCNLLERVDLNWASDKTMRAKPKYISEQLSSDQNSRYGRYYMTLDEEGKKKFIFDGMLEKGNLKIYPEEKDPDGKSKPVKTYSDPFSVDCLSKKEKDVFRKACNVYFSPIKEDGSPDKDLFVERVDAVSNEIANLYKKHAEFVGNEENFKGILDNPKDHAARMRAAKYISPFFKKITAYESEMKEIFGRSKVNKELKKHYIFTKMNIEDKKGADDLDKINFAIQEVFAKEVNDKSGLQVESFVEEQGNPLSDKEMAKATEKSNGVTAGMLEEHRSNKPWLNAGRDVSMDSLEKMKNLYEQFKNEDRLIYINSDEYTDLKNRLKEAADIYKEVSKRKKPELSSTEKVEMECAFDAISDAALKYIKGKEEKARQTDHGQNRYEIAFAALGIASKGAFNEKIERHNIKHIFRDSKKLSLEDLMNRGERTVEQQKAYEKIHKPRKKQKQRKSAPIKI